jgi:hypothetical protein
MPARVEKIARESLRMQLPASSRVEIVESAKGKASDDDAHSAESATVRSATVLAGAAR